MSNRFHSKYHRHNHHTYGITDPRYPDAAHDPIASPDSPFLGDFVMYGTLSATAIPIRDGVVQQTAGFFQSNTVGIHAIAPLSGISVLSEGNTLVTGNLSASNLFLNGVPELEPIQATTTGKFLVINVNGVPYGIRLWNLI
jgi:hypothetical protein